MVLTQDARFKALSSTFLLFRLLLVHLVITRRHPQTPTFELPPLLRSVPMCGRRLSVKRARVELLREAFDAHGSVRWWRDAMVSSTNAQQPFV